VLRQQLFHSRSPWFAYERQPAAEHDYGGMEQMDYMRKPKRQFVGCLFDDLLRSRVADGQGVGQMPGFAAAHSAHQPGKL